MITLHRIGYTTGVSPGIALLGFPCDEGVRRNQGRVGARKGPAALRQALANFAWHPTYPIYDAGDVLIHKSLLAQAQCELATQVTALLAAGQFPLVLGGGHETAYGSWRGLANAYPDKVIGIINLDAHFDLRLATAVTSGTPFMQIAAACDAEDRPFHYLCLGVAEASNTQALFTRARALGADWRLDSDMHEGQLHDVQQQVLAFVQYVDGVYLSIDLDVLPAAVMPAVSAPAAYGVVLNVIVAVITWLAGSGKLLLADVVELNPDFDRDHHRAYA
jgi:formiminoglutamase